MNLLFLTQLLPYPLDGGSKVKSWHLLRHLSQTHTVTLATFSRPEDDPFLETVRSEVAYLITVPMVRKRVDDLRYLAQSIAQNKSFLLLRDDRPAMRHALSQLDTDFDAVYIVQLNMAQYADIFPTAKIILDHHDVLYRLYTRLAETARYPLKWLWERESKQLVSEEATLCAQMDTILAVSDEDKDALTAILGSDERIEIMPIAIDADAQPVVSRKENAGEITHVGTMYWPPNVDGINWFLDEVRPLLETAGFAGCINLVGKNPPAALLQRGDDVVRVTGFVPDLTPILAETAVFIVPLRVGTGMRVKILNSLAQGLPVVTTSIGCEGIAVEDGVHVLIADTAQGFADAVMRLLHDRGLADRLGMNGRVLIAEKYEYTTIGAQLDEILTRKTKLESTNLVGVAEVADA